MARIQRTLSATIAATVMLGAFAFNAQAQTAPTSQPATAAAQKSPHHHPHMAKKDAAQSHAQRMERLKTILQLQPNQQTAFDQYVQATTPQARTQISKAERPDLAKMTTPQRLDLAQKLRKERNAKAEQREQATRNFYNSLTSSQQKAFDEITARAPSKHPGHQKQGKRGERPNHQPRAVSGS